MVVICSIGGVASDDESSEEQMQPPVTSQDVDILPETNDASDENSKSPVVALPEEPGYSAEILSALSDVCSEEEISDFSSNDRNTVVVIQKDIGPDRPDNWDEIRQNAVDASIEIGSLESVTSEHVSLILHGADSKLVLSVANGDVIVDAFPPEPEPSEPIEPLEPLEPSVPSEFDEMVWIPTNGGTKYHSNQYCSDMDNPKQVTKEDAISQDYTACKKCYG